MKCLCSDKEQAADNVHGSQHCKCAVGQNELERKECVRFRNRQNASVGAEVKIGVRLGRGALLKLFGISIWAWCSLGNSCS